MKAVNLNHLSSSGYNPKEWEQIPEIKAARPNMIKHKFVEVSLQRLDTHKKIILVMWMGAKNGVWHNASDIFLITEK